jgi:single-stranded DNA-binding protein
LTHTLKKGMRVLIAEFMMGRIRSTGKLVQRTFEVEGNKRTVVEIQVTHVGPDLQFATAEVAKSTAEGLSSTSDGSPSVEEKQSAWRTSRREASGLPEASGVDTQERASRAEVADPGFQSPAHRTGLFPGL